MSNPDFPRQGYQVERELGQNRAGGRVTYLATDTNTQLPVVLKQFQFAQSGANWSEYDAVNREIQLLRSLNHPSIPQYLDSFETPSGFCLVQEYKPASSLAQPHHWEPEEIKSIAVAVLEVLVYLQQQVPLIIHRDIKPENILVARQQKLQVYLVDFGFASFGDREVAVSSVVKGTLGFMPPEQLFNRQLTEASDLYSLGATLICLLTGIKSTQIGNLIDEAYRINFKSLVPKLNPQFIDWLEKMVAPNLKNRYPNAAAALEALQVINVVGKTTTLAMLVRAIKLKPAATAVGLATLGFVALFSVSVDPVFHEPPQLAKKIQSPENTVRQLLETKQCRRCDLRGANLEGTDLTDANLSDADLSGANLKKADLTGAYLNSTNLRGANLQFANLKWAELGNAELKGASLVFAKLRTADLSGADLQGADLSGTNLQGADLEGANLQCANLQCANLQYAKLKGADLGDTELMYADLTNADLRTVDLSGAYLLHANLKGANLEGAYLKDAIMPNESIHH